MLQRGAGVGDENGRKICEAERGRRGELSPLLRGILLGQRFSVNKHVRARAALRIFVLFLQQNQSEITKMSADAECFSPCKQTNGFPNVSGVDFGGNDLEKEE